jgi:hypothetical protein
MNTPFLPAFRHLLAPMGSRSLRTAQHLRTYTLCQLESCLGHWLPSSLFPKATQKENSRDASYTRWRTFWCMLWQALNPEAPGREVVRQLQALFRLTHGPVLSEDDGAYCRAKARLPLAEFAKALAATAQAADRLAPAVPAPLQGRPLKAIDGSALTLPDLGKNRRAYPPVHCPDGPAFPMMRMVVLFSLLSGAISAVAHGSLALSELALFESLSHLLRANDILIGDRGFGSYPVIARLRTGSVDFIGRTNRRVDGRRRLRRLGRADWLVLWRRGQKPSPWLSALQWAGLPKQMTLRAIKGSCFRKGFRVRRVTVVTTLLDAEQYPAQQILQAYLRRWRLEMCLDDLKTTLKLDLLRSHSPAMAQKELLARLIAHNLIRCVVAQAAAQCDVEIQRISFKGTLDALRHFSLAMSQARTQKKRRDLWTQLLQTLAADLVPERPGRREPRAVKRKKNRYPRLIGPRHKFKDHLKRHTRRKLARLRKLRLM